MATLTFDGLPTLSAPVQDADILAAFRGVQTYQVTAAVLRAYMALTFLSLTGGTLTGALLADVGSLALPGIAFDGDTDTGLYRVSANRMGIVAGGNRMIDVKDTGVEILGLNRPYTEASEDYTLGLTDAGGLVMQTGTSKTITIPANATTAFEVGTTIDVATDGASCTIAAAGGVTLQFFNGGGSAPGTGSRTLARAGVGTLYKRATNVWMLSGIGIT